ncbi:MAG: hypothetical protein R2711_17040 [Acidimicrobiales bacterium]
MDERDTVAQKVVWSIPIVAFVVLAAAVLLVAQLRGASERPGSGRSCSPSPPPRRSTGPSGSRSSG